MRMLASALALLCLAGPALAEDPAPADKPPAPPADAAPAPAPADAAPAPAAPAPDGAAAAAPRPPPIPRAPRADAPTTARPSAPEGTDPALLDAVSHFFGALRAGDADALLATCKPPFRLETEDLRGPYELRKRFLEMLGNKPLAHVPLYGIEVLPSADMTVKHGPPPARLGALDLAGAFVAVANFGGKAAVAVFRGDARGYRAVAFTD